MRFTFTYNLDPFSVHITQGTREQCRWLHLKEKVLPVVQRNEVEVGNLDRRPKLQHKPKTICSVTWLTVWDVNMSFNTFHFSCFTGTHHRNLHSNLRSAHRCSPVKQSKDKSRIGIISRTTNHRLFMKHPKSNLEVAEVKDGKQAPLWISGIYQCLQPLISPTLTPWHCSGRCRPAAYRP